MGSNPIYRAYKQESRFDSCSVAEVWKEIWVQFPMIEVAIERLTTNRGTAERGYHHPLGLERTVV